MINIQPTCLFKICIKVSFSLLLLCLAGCHNEAPPKNIGGEVAAGEIAAGEVAAGEVVAGQVTAGQESADLLRGEELYQQFCGFCHGAEGEGYLADNANALSNQDFLSVATDEFLTLSTVHGRSGTPMSPW